MSDNPAPMSFAEARTAAHQLADARRRAEEEYRAQGERAADAEANYRKKFAAVYLAEEGPVTEREQKARAATADICRNRDIQVVMLRAFLERLRGLEGERASLRQLMEWSQRIDTQLTEIPR